MFGANDFMTINGVYSTFNDDLVSALHEVSLRTSERGISLSLSLIDGVIVSFKATIYKKLVSAPQRLHMGMRAGVYFIIISHYSMMSLSLVNTQDVQKVLIPCS